LYGAVKRELSSTYADAQGFSRLTLGYNSLEQANNQYTSSDAWKESLNYQMARLNYKYAYKYLMTATIRRDGFSGFAANKKYAYFPSFAVGWILSEESFFKVKGIDFLKVRAGYGVSGNQTSRYKSLARVTTQNAYIFGDGGSTLIGQELNSLANPDLKWEKTKGINAGLDFKLFQGRISGSIDLYSNTTNDLLFDVAIPNISGFSTISTNVGQLQNRGLEIVLTSRNIDYKNFHWNTTVNFTTNANKIVKLTGADANNDGKEDDMVASGLFIGEPTGAIYGYQVNGIYQLGETPPAGYYTGTYRIVDQDGEDYEITPDDRIILGHTEPAYRISILNKIEYKGFTLSVFLNSIQGGKRGYLGNNTRATSRSDVSIRFNNLDAINYWSPGNPDGEYPQSVSNPTVQPTVYRDRSFIRLQDITLSYQFKGYFIKKLNIEDLSLFVSGKNLATWTKWKGWDPETGQGLINDGRPVMKGYSIGCNVTF
jgi:TonB-linked SusC/RagA family outer membrane protein